MPVIAIVDDDQHVRESVACLLSSHDYRVATFDSAQSLVNSPLLVSINCVISDIHMPDSDGFALLDKLHSANSYVPVVLMSAYIDASTKQRFSLSRATALISKPFDSATLIHILANTL